MARLLDGKVVAACLDDQTRCLGAELESAGIVPTLGIVSASSKRDSVAYVRSVRACCERLGISVVEAALADDASEAAVVAAVNRFADDDAVHGVVICQPLPPHVDGNAVAQAIPAGKDVDGVTPHAMVKAYYGHGEGFLPSVCEAAMRMLEYYEVDLDGRNAVVIGDGPTVGRPLWLLLLHAGATPTTCNIYTHDVPGITKRADVVISATGNTDGFGSDYFSDGQTVIDVGVGYSERLGRLSGDVRFDEVEPLVSAITPVPGGVGVVTSSMLALHVMEAARAICRRFC